VHLRNNRILGNRFGLFIVSTNSRTSDSKVLSQANIIHDNQAGGFIIAGFSPTGAPAGDSTTGHRMWFNSQWDSFLYNITPSGDSDPLFLSLGGGLVAFAAGRDSATAGLNSDNQLSLQLLHSTFLGNVGVPGPLHLTLIGSFSSPISTPKTGSDNELSVLMRHTISDGEPDSFVLADSFPEDPLGTNAITLIGSAVAFERTNLGWEVPPEEFFLSREK
jgi:hypothetical protein